MKKWKVVLVTGILLLFCAGCGAQDNENTVIISNDSDKSVESNDVEDDAIGNEAAKETEEAKNDAAAEPEAKTDSGQNATFAEQIKTAMADKDMAALAGLCSYPLSVDGEVIESKDSFMELDEAVIFTDERCAAIEAVDTSSLEETAAGVIMGESTPNIIFQSVDGTLGITGIN